MYDTNKFIENFIIEEQEPSNEIDGIYVADFETSKVSKYENEVFVYATGLMDVLDNTNKCCHTNNIKDFIENISKLPYLESKIYFHNLSFDTVFCLLELIDKGFEQIRNKYKVRSDGGLQYNKNNKTININKEVSRTNKNDEEKYLKRPYSYNIIFNNGSFYRVDIYFNFEFYKDKNNRKKIKLRKVSLMDSYKLVPMSLKKVAKDFLNYEMSKDGIDHNVIRCKNYQLKEKEKEYLYEDVKVLKDFIHLTTIDGIEVNKDYTIYFNKMTTASQALHEYKTILESVYNSEEYKSIKAFNECFTNGVKQVEKENKKGYKTKVDKDLLFLSTFPTLHPNIDAYLRQSYYGGITWKNEKLLNKLESNNIPLKGVVYDVNSLYPSVMREKLLPYGTPKFFEGSYKNIPEFVRKEYPLYIQRVRVKMFNIKPNKSYFLYIL